MILLFLALACRSTDETDPADTDIVDTDPADTDPVDTDVVADQIEVEVRAGGAGKPGWRVAAVLATLEDGTVTDEREWLSVDASTLPVRVSLVPPGPEDVGLLDGVNIGALFFWVLYDDADASGTRGPDEPVLAASNEVLAWIDDGERFDRIWVGLALDLAGDADAAIFDAFSGFDLTVLPHREAITLGGTTALAPDRLALVSAAELESGSELPERPYDAAWTGSPWSLTVSTPLDPQRWYTSDQGAVVGVEIPTAILDSDADGTASPGDASLGVACYAGEPAGLLFAPEPMSLVSSLTFLVTGFDVGWNLVGLGDPEAVPERIPEAQASALTLDACGP